MTTRWGPEEKRILWGTREPHKAQCLGAGAATSVMTDQETPRLPGLAAEQIAAFARRPTVAQALSTSRVHFGEPTTLTLKCLSIWRAKNDTALLRIGLTLCPAGL